MVPRKLAKFETPGYNFSEMFFVIYSRKTGKYLNQGFFCRKFTRNRVDEIVVVKF